MHINIDRRGVPGSGRMGGGGLQVLEGGKGGGLHILEGWVGRTHQFLGVDEGKKFLVLCMATESGKECTSVAVLPFRCVGPYLAL